ncbi:hypothetical protein S40288_06322 [Stachybotrys chartarum IBT 40288]|nr:hypothetical protein S40288_06322 [Stachybotrys chartarum IBT 40288]
MSSADLFRQYQGHMVPHSHGPGFVALSYVVSFVGAASTLELINRRTGFRGLYNNLLLIGAAVTMGGVAIWSMHFIGNRAIQMGEGEDGLQIAFSGGITALSFFVPIVVLALAFVAIGSSSIVSWWRVCVGGLLCGTGVCGMHYLGNLSIRNYTCEYEPANVVGSAIIAVTASTVALSMFFVFRAMWANVWWKRGLSALMLAGAVSGMHWCAAVGTRYRLVRVIPLEESEQNTTLIVVICLSVIACMTIAGLAILRARNMSRSAERAQKITLAAAVFDLDGRILVDPDGLVPSTIITNSFPETNDKEGFGVAHPLYHWMFQASRNWTGILNLVGSIRKHLARTRLEQSNTRMGADFGERGLDYDIVFRELFCDAAMTLADRLRENLPLIGILWDEILPTGASGRDAIADAGKTDKTKAGDEDAVEKGSYQGPQYGRGSLLFLVRRIRSDRDADKLASAGYRFADLHQVSSIIASTMQIQTPGVESKLRDMANYADQEELVKPGVHLGFFAIKARVNTSGFDILVRRGARHLLPSTQLATQTLEPWHMEMLKRFDGVPFATMLRGLDSLATSTASTDRERKFMRKLGEGTQALLDLVQDPILNEAVFTAEPVALPGISQEYGETKSMVAFRLVVPIHSVAATTACEFIPLSFFKAHQQCQGHQLNFIQDAHREFGPVVHEAAQRMEKPAPTRGRLSKLSWHHGRSSLGSNDDAGADDKPLAANTTLRMSGRSNHSTSTINLCKSDYEMQGVEMSYGPASSRAMPPSFGGIMISQEITVNVESARKDEMGPSTPSSEETLVGDKHKLGHKNAASATEVIEMGYVGRDGTTIHAGTIRKVDRRDKQEQSGQSATFVDVLFRHCVEGRLEGM